MGIAEEFAKLLLRQVPIGIGVWDATDAESPQDLKLMYINDWAYARLMKGFISPVGKTVRQITAENNRGPNKEFVEGLFEMAQARIERGSEIKQFGGRTYCIHYRMLGSLVSASIFEDVTEVSDANNKLSHALASAKAGMWWFDHVQDTQSWDSGAAALAGLGGPASLPHTSYKTFLSCIDKKDAPDTEHLLTQALGTSGVENVELEFRLQRADGQRLTVMDRVRIIRVDDVAVQTIHVFIDITDKAQLTSQLTQSNSDLKNFAHVASHDLREPLRVIINYVTLLFEEYGGQLTDPSAQQYREFIESSAGRAMALVDDLLRFSRAGNSMNPQVASCARLAQIATANLEMAIQEVNAKVTIEALPVVLCDAGMMVQVFQNLIGNAVKFGSPATVQPEIRVFAEETDRFWRISVKDNGIGVEAEYLTKIFTPFYRLYTVAEYAGTGIGLALCQKIVRAHGGDIWAESEGRGQGTTLNFTLPKT